MSALVDFVSATPPPLILHLVPLAPLIHNVRHIADIVSWNAPWEESVLLLALWWSLCLFADLTLKFFLPVAVLFVFALRHWSDPALAASPPPATDAVIHALVDDIAAIHALLPDHTTPPPSLALVRIAAFLYLPYLVLTYLIPLRICVAIAGTLLLTHRARWARNARAALARSAHLRWAFYHIHTLFSGTPVPAESIPTPPPEYASRPVSGATVYTNAPSHVDDDDPSAPRPSPPLRFLFTVYENQRWWVGLDWTAALLPSERPSWCSASQLPLPPPSTFSLPSPATSFVPVGKHGRAKRLARWTWEEPEWRVVVRKEGQDGLWRVEKTPPKDKETTDDTGTAARMLRAARGRDASGGGPSESPERDKKAPADQQATDPSIIPAEDDIVTDPEGWVYWDNKWENASSKGGMGKYTRYRRWTRIAILTETVELVGPGEFGVLRDSGAFSTSSTSNAGNTSSMVTAGVVSPTASNFSDWESTGSAAEQPKDQKDATTSKAVLRQRLKAVMDGSSH